jgi:hypothetical protein
MLTEELEAKLDPTTVTLVMPGFPLPGEMVMLSE